jgi:hypothetical protein
MAVLTPQQRNTLESAVKHARKVAEQGANNALHAMAVDHPEPFAHMDATERSLRNSLRSKARLLGDELKANSEQAIHHLSYELAYETWHKMLFAKFLEANHLLMHPDGVAVTMEDCEELGKEEGYADKWDAAANYASRMLPAIFRVDDPLMKVGYATDDRIKLEGIIEGLENAIFTADDALGWVYQFWQSEAKAAINASGDKIDGEKLPAVTQLFTEPYMVHFLIDNTLGAWWVSRNPDVKPPIKFEYLRFSPPPSGEVGMGLPAAGKFEGWPDKTAEVTSLDPCMGSGHFVASLFPVFAALRMHEEGLTKEQVTDKVIAENLHGLELDARCTQIAAFNLALTAWKFCGHYKVLPEMNLACSGIAPKGKEEDWVKLVGKVARFEDKERMENGMRMLYEHFQLAPELGSLLDPTTIKADAFTASFEELQPVLKRALESEADTEQMERGVIAAGIAKTGSILSSKHTLLITNVPFVGTRKQAEILKSHCEKNFPNAKHDIATCMIERCCNLLRTNGSFAFVSPHNWLFLGAYLKFRKSLLEKYLWNFVAFLGPRSFRTTMYDFSIGLAILTNKKSFANNLISGVIVEKYLTPEEKSDRLTKESILRVSQISQIENPDSRITLEEKSNISLLQNSVSCLTGVLNGDSPKFIKLFWEFENWPIEWAPLQGTSNSIKYYYGREQLIFFDKVNGHLREDAKIRRERLHDSDQRGNSHWGKKGVMVHRMGSLPVTLYSGDIYDQNGAVIVPNKGVSIESLWVFLTSKEFSDEVRKLDNKVGVTPATLAKVPFDLEYWQKVAEEKYPNGLPKPYSDDPTQWLFHGHPIKTDNPLQVALARVLGYRWPAENDIEMELAEEARAFIEAVKAFDQLSDEDGIFCIPSVNTEQGGAERLRDYLQVVFKEEWSSQTITQLLQKEGANATNLEAWLRDEFFVQHCKVFQNRPFIWHIWDGRKDGFSVLVNYHRLTKDNLSKLIYTYLGDWIRMCEAKKKAGESGAEGLLSAAQKLKEKLEAILEGEAPYDIFVRWKPLEQQPIGWEPDLNDGVRLNIRPFIEADVLRKKPNIKWGVDRGKNTPGSPWGEVRDNDKHLSLEEKRAARERTHNS